MIVEMIMMVRLILTFFVLMIIMALFRMPFYIQMFIYVVFIIAIIMSMDVRGNTMMMTSSLIRTDVESMLMAKVTAFLETACLD